MLFPALWQVMGYLNGFRILVGRPLLNPCPHSGGQSLVKACFSSHMCMADESYLSYVGHVLLFPEDYSIFMAKLEKANPLQVSSHFHCLHP